MADARCLQLLVTRAARVRFRAGRCVLEDEGDLRAALLGGGEGPAAVAGLGVGVPADTSIDINLLRDRWEWEAIERCVHEVAPVLDALKVAAATVAEWSPTTPSTTTS